MMRPPSFLLATMAATLLHAFAPASLLPPTVLEPLGTSTDKCQRCTGFVFPGGLKPHPVTPWAVHSDLPELYWGTGVLYATTPVLPPFVTMKDEPVPEAMRRQLRAGGFEALDGSFDVFLYHLAQPGGGKDPSRIVVYVRNDGTEPIRLRPRTMMEGAGKMGADDGPETRLARRFLAEHWDAPLEEVRLAPQEGNVLAWTPIVGATEAGPDAQKEAFITGMVRVAVEGTKPRLTAWVVAVPPEPVGRARALAEGLLQKGAKSGETAMNLLIPPPDCHVRRVVGVFRNFVWEGTAPVVLNVDALTAEGTSFQMALPAVQAVGCEAARQTQDLALHPPYVRPDTIGNYMGEYVLALRLQNAGKVARRADVRFGKQDADIGLAWQTATGSEVVGRDGLAGLPVQSGWAGGWRKDDRPDNTRSFFADGEAPVLAPGEAKVVSLRLLIAGTSSLPFQLVVAGEDVQ